MRSPQARPAADSAMPAADSTRPPAALTIAGTDPSGGAGIQADLKAFTARSVLGTAAITALVAQNTHGVSRVYPVDEDFVADQIASVLDDMPIDATKSGMLGSRGLVRLVARSRRAYPMGFYTADPVMVSASGHRLLDVDAVATFRDELLPLTDLVTPNLPEAALLLGDDVDVADGAEQMRRQARELVARGAGAALVTGGHATGEVVVDVLVTGDGRTEHFRHPRIDTPNTHGTGCTISAAITAEVAARTHGAEAELPESSSPESSSPDAGRPDADLLCAAVADAGDYLHRALVSAAGWTVSHDPRGAHGPVDHSVDIHPDAGTGPSGTGPR